MILHAIELANVGPFRQAVKVGLFAPGLNVLAAPNETGKSTALKAVARALFDRHTTKGEDLQALQPAGTDLAPRVAVEFSTAAGRYRIEKTFLHRPRSLLTQWRGGFWQPLAEADAADARVQELLGSGLPGRGSTQPAHWGFLGFLWARQGESIAWPALDEDELGEKIRHRLAHVEIDPVMEKLRQRLEVMAGEIFTATGQAKAGGTLKRAEDDLDGIARDLAQIEARRQQIETLRRRFYEAGAEVVRLEAAEVAARQTAEELARQAAATERLHGELKRHESDLATAREKLAGVAGDLEHLAKLNQDLEATAGRIAVAAAAMTAAAATQQAASTRLEHLRAQKTVRDRGVAELRAMSARVADLLKLRQMAAESAALARQAAEAEEMQRRCTLLQERAAALPAITAAELAHLEQLATAQRELHQQVQALGLTVELTVQNAAEVKSTRRGRSEIRRLTPAVPETWHSPDALDLRLPGWGRIRIRSGAREVQELQADLLAQEKAFQAALSTAHVASLEAARGVAAARAEIDGQEKLAQATLATRLDQFSSLATLQDAATDARKRTDALRESLRPDQTESELAQAALEAESERLRADLRAAAMDLQAVEKEHSAQVAAERGATLETQACRDQARLQEARQETLRVQIADLTARYPTGLESAKALAQTAFTEAEARADTTRRNLPPNFRDLPDLSRQAATELQRVSGALKACRTTGDATRGALELAGGQGLYARETELLEQQAEAIRRRDAARARGWAARVTHDLIEYRKQAATKSVLAPLEHRLSAALADITGETERRVFLNEGLRIAGLGRSRAEAHDFAHLSQGAKEQLLLCLRLAVAQELSATEPQVVILDDSLVNTDPARQQRVLEVLARLGETLQIVILTCHPERYRDLGTALAIESVG